MSIINPFGYGMSVTHRIKSIKQPNGGYIKPSQFSVQNLGNTDEFYSPENVHASLIGMAVDYLTRLMLGATAQEAFKISLLGARNINETANAKKLLADIKGLDDVSIINAIKITGYDVCYRFGATAFVPIDTINPNENSIKNVRTMVERSLHFIDLYGPIIKDGFTFEGGYTKIIDAGDGDFLTSDTLWDFKVLKSKPTNKNTLQLLVYWRMGLHSIHPEFKNIKYLGIYNPRLNNVYRIAVSDIPDEVIEEVEWDVIGYNI